MTTVLRKDEVAKFLAVSRERKWGAPKIYSAWFINKLPEDTAGKKLVELANSTFGLEMARQLTPVAKIVRETKDAATLEAQMDTLFAVLNWLGNEPAYANMLLQERVDDIASVAATKLMCDINHPMEKAEKAMKRFDDQSWGSPERRRQVLFEESGGKHFLSDNSGATQEKLDKEFREGVSLVIQLGSIIERPDLEIFAAETYRQGEQRGDLENAWTKRDHVHFGEVGFFDETVRRRNLTQLHEFRRRYGKFPSQPVSYTPKPGENMIRAAFKELSWENPYEVVGADDTFEAYLEDRLVDEVFQSTDRRFNPNAKSK